MSLIAVYRLDEGLGEDRVGSLGTEPSLPANPFGDNPSATGLIGDALVCGQGTATLGRDADAGLGTLESLQTFTISFWYKPLSAAEIFNGLFLTWSSLELSFSGGRPGLVGFSLSPTDRDAMVTAATPTLNEWSHIVLTGDNATGELAIYVDGVLDQSSTTEPAFIPGGLGNIQLGGNDSGQYLLDMLCIYDHVVDTDTIATLYNDGAGFDPTADNEEERSNDEMNLTEAEWQQYALDYDRMQLDGGTGKIHLPCFDPAFESRILEDLPADVRRRVVFASRGGRGSVG